MTARDPYEGLGDAIRQVRLERGLTRAAVKEEAKISLEYLGKIEQGVRRPQPDVLQRIAGALGMTSQSLLQRARDMRLTDPPPQDLARLAPVVAAALAVASGGRAAPPFAGAVVAALGTNAVVTRAQRLRQRRQEDHLRAELEKKLDALDHDQLALMLALIERAQAEDDVASAVDPS